MSNLRKKRRAAFTLTELIITLGLLAVLAAAAFAALSGLEASRREREALGQAEALANALNVYNAVVPDSAEIVKKAYGAADDSASVWDGAYSSSGSGAFILYAYGSEAFDFSIVFDDRTRLDRAINNIRCSGGLWEPEANIQYAPPFSNPDYRGLT